MRRILKITIIVLLFGSLKSIACSCPPETYSSLLKKEKTNSRDIFIGEIVSVKDLIDQNFVEYEIKINEVIKGDLKLTNIISVRISIYCPPELGESGRVIIFSNDKFEDTFIVNQCGLSVNMDRPEKNNRYRIPPPPSLESDNANSDNSEISEDDQVKFAREMLSKVLNDIKK